MLFRSYGRADTEQGYDRAKIYYKLFAHVHPTDFKYVYGVPKGNPELFDSPMFISSEVEDCQQNNTKNVVAAEHFWNNPVFMKNTGRKMFVGSIEDKFKAFGWHVVSIDGHDFEQILKAIELAKAVETKPTMIVANTIKGKGVDFMENVCGFHGVAPTEEETKRAIEQLEKTSSI